MCLSIEMSCSSNTENRIWSAGYILTLLYSAMLSRYISFDMRTLRYDSSLKCLLQVLNLGMYIHNK
jgi:hypothetical protein